MELLRHVIGPSPYSSVWLWLSVGLVLALLIWYAAVFVLTVPGRQIRDLPLVGSARAEVIRRRSARSIRAIGNGYRAGDLTADSAAAALSRELRRFLHAATGIRAEYMHVTDIADGPLAPAAPILQQLTDVQFNQDSAVDVAVSTDRAEELIRQWT